MMQEDNKNELEMSNKDKVEEKTIVYESEAGLSTEVIKEKHVWSGGEYSLLFLYFGFLIFLIVAIYFDLIVDPLEIPSLLLFFIPLLISLVAKLLYTENKFFQILFKINCFLIYLLIMLIKCILLVIKEMVTHID